MELIWHGTDLIPVCSDRHPIEES